MIGHCNQAVQNSEINILPRVSLRTVIYVKLSDGFKAKLSKLCQFLTLVRVILLCYSLEKYSFIKDNMFDYLMLHEHFLNNQNNHVQMHAKYTSS